MQMFLHPYSPHRQSRMDGQLVREKGGYRGREEARKKEGRHWLTFVSVINLHLYISRLSAQPLPVWCPWKEKTCKKICFWHLSANLSKWAIIIWQFIRDNYSRAIKREKSYFFWISFKKLQFLAHKFLKKRCFVKSCKQLFKYVVCNPKSHKVTWLSLLYCFLEFYIKTVIHKEVSIHQKQFRTSTRFLDFIPIFCKAYYLNIM